MPDLRQLLRNNRAWAEGVARENPGFFKRLASQHAPPYLWIGCSDARVPANQIVGLEPGELFVHRNVGNVVVGDDPNLLAVLELAVDVLEVPHIIVCGHYGCYGVASAWRGDARGHAREWLRRIEDVAAKHEAFLGECGSEDEALRGLCELNVLEQAMSACRTEVVRGAWRRGMELRVHAWIYAIEDGLIRDLGLSVASAGGLDDAYQMALARAGGGAARISPS